MVDIFSRRLRKHDFFLKSIEKPIQFFFERRDINTCGIHIEKVNNTGPSSNIYRHLRAPRAQKGDYILAINNITYHLKTSKILKSKQLQSLKIFQIM